MNTIPPTNLMQIRQQGLELLNRELGPVVMIRFLQQFELGQGDYSTERHQWLDGHTVADWLAQIRARRLRCSCHSSSCSCAKASVGSVATNFSHQPSR